jgi:hypothetical protein
MIEKKNVEAFLKVNGIPPTAKDEEIRSVLLSARWNNNEVDTALMVLKENTKTNDTHVDTLHKVFNTDDRLSSAEISSLLGIDVYLSGEDVGDINKKRQGIEKLKTTMTLVLSLLIAFSSITYLMYREKAGFFHENPPSKVNVK